MARSIPPGSKAGPINDNANAPGEPDDNVVQPFQLENSKIRGRVVRLGKVLDDILGPHDYPAPVAHIVAEMITLTALLSSMLKYEGIFTLQTKGDGPVKMAVADMMSNGDIRGCASFDPERVKKFGDDTDLLPLFLGKGYIAFTVDQAHKTDRYQGIVELRGKSLVECVQHYFAQSEQINTEIRIAVDKYRGKWRAGGIMIQHMPDEEKGAVQTADERKEDWNRAVTLLSTVRDEELVNRKLYSRELLIRLFHEEGVRVYKPQSIQNKCRCDATRIQKIVASLPKEDIEYLMENGTIKMHCEFCSKEYTLEPDALKQRLSEEDPQKK